MSRIPTPATIADAPEAAQPLLRAVERQLGSVPDLFRITATSDAKAVAKLDPLANNLNEVPGTAVGLPAVRPVAA